MPQFSISDICMTWPRLQLSRSIQQYNVFFVGPRNGSVVHLISHRTANLNIGSSIHPWGRNFFFSINVNANHCNMFLYQIGLIFYIFYLKDNLLLFVLTHSRNKVMTISLMLGKNMIYINIQTVFFFTWAVCLGRFKYDITLFFTISPLPPPLTLTTFHIVIFFKANDHW